MSGIALCILGGTFSSPTFFIGRYFGSGSPEFISVAYNSTDFYFNGALSGGSGQETTFVQYNEKGVIQTQRNFAISGNLSQLNSAATTNNIFLVGAQTVSGTQYGSIAKIAISPSLSGPEWVKWVRNSGTSRVRGVAADSSNNSYVSGETDFSRPGIVVVKYNSGGTIQWQNQFGGDSTNANSTTARGITVDSSGNVYITGFGNATSPQSPIVVKYNSSGVLQWQRQLVFSGKEAYGVGIETDSSGDVYVTGFLVDPQPVMLIYKLNSSGSLQWQRKVDFGSASQPGEKGGTNVISIDSSGFVYIAGARQVPGGGKRWVILKYNSSGVLQFQRELQLTSSSSDIEANSIVVDNLGSFIVAGNGPDSLFAKLPVTGALTGSYTIGAITVSYQASSGTESAASGAEGTPTYNSATSSISNTDGSSYSLATNSLTSITTTIP
jgi:hypothetical protein